MQTLNDNNLADYYKRLDYAEIKAAIGDWAKDYPCIEKISLYRMKRDKDFPNDPRYVFVVVAPGVPAKSDRNSETAQNIIRYFEEIHEDCSHIHHLMEDFYRIDILPNREIPLGYPDEWFWFTITPEEHIEDYEIVMDVKPLVLYERNDPYLSAASAGIKGPGALSPAESGNSGNANATYFDRTDEKGSIKLPDIHKVQKIEEGKNSFRLSGDFWEVRYKGQSVLLKNLERIRYIVHLVEKPNKEFSARFLVSLVKKNRPWTTEKYDKLIDEQLRGEGFGHGADLSTELPKEEFENLKKIAYRLWNKTSIAPDDENAKADWARCKGYMQEYGVLVKERHDDLIFTSKSRLNEDAEKARSNVQKRVAAAIKDIRKKLPPLADHLQDKISTGKVCVYKIDSDNQLNWDISW